MWNDAPRLHLNRCWLLLGRRRSETITREAMEWYFLLPCLMITTAVGCSYMSARQRRRRGAQRRLEHAQQAAENDVEAMADEAALAEILSPGARVIDFGRQRGAPHPSPYVVPRAGPAVPDKGDDMGMLDLAAITLEDEKDLRENFPGDSVFRMKAKWLDQQLRMLHSGHETAIKLVVDRNDLFFDSFRTLSKCTGEQLRGPLQVAFKNEDGRDDGGLTRHWFMLISREIVNPGYGMFALLPNGAAFHIHPASKHQSHYLEYFRFIGRVWGKAIYDGFHVDSHLAPCIYNYLLSNELDLPDLKAVDLTYYNSLVWLLENDIEAAELELVFVLEQEELEGHVVKVPLKVDGHNIVVNNSNKDEYVRLAAKQRLVGGISEQLEALKQGFYDVVPAEVLVKFSEGELELLLHGMPVIDVDDWKANCEYRAGFSAGDEVIVWFWECVQEWDQEMRARLLQFVTGTSKLPTAGFAGLYGATGPKRFQIIRVYDITRLPQANTCFNELLLPPYPSKQLLADRFAQSLFEGGDVFMLR